MTAGLSLTINEKFTCSISEKFVVTIWIIVFNLVNPLTNFEMQKCY